MHLQTIRTFTVVMDTGAGLNLVHLKVFPLRWEKMRQEKKSPKVTDETLQIMDIRRILLLYVPLWHRKVRNVFLVHPDLGPEVILGTRLIDRYAKEIHSGKKRVPSHLRAPLAIFGSRQGPEAGPTKLRLPTRTVSNKVMLSKVIGIPSMTDVVTAAVCTFSGLVTLQKKPKLATKNLSLMANLVMNVLPNWEFAVKMSNFRDKLTKLPKGMVVGISLPVSVTIMEVDHEELLIVGQQPAILETGIKLGEDPEPYRADVIYLFKDFAGSWSGTMREIYATKHRIDLNDGAMLQ